LPGFYLLKAELILFNQGFCVVSVPLPGFYLLKADKIWQNFHQ